MSAHLNCILKDNWNYLNIGGKQYIVKSLIEEADSQPFYVVLFSNFVDIWSEKLLSKDVVKRNSKLNPNIEVPTGRLLSHIREIFKSSKLSITNKDEDEITIVSRSKLSSLPYKWEFKLSRCDKQVVADQLTFPLIAAIAELNRQNEHLVKIISEKDAQIESCDSENILSKDKKCFEMAAFQKDMSESEELVMTVSTSINITFGKKLEPVFKSVNEKLFQSSQKKDKLNGVKRKSYSVEFKKRIVEESRNSGMNILRFCEEKKLDSRMVRKWRAKFDNLSKQVDEGHGKKRKLGSGRQPVFMELENTIVQWIAGRSATALEMSRADIKAFALVMAQQLNITPEQFKASNHWLDNFLQRHELSLRKSTTLSKLKESEVINENLLLGQEMFI